MKSIDVKLLPMSAPDWPDVTKIYQEGIDTGKATFETEVPTWEAWDDRHLNEARWIAVSRETIVGWVALSPVSTRKVYKGVAEVSIYIRSAFQGLGIGKLLMKKLIEESEAAGVWSLQAVIFRDNASSIEFHHKYGFRMIGYREKIGKRDGIWLDNVMMERRSRRVGYDQ